MPTNDDFFSLAELEKPQMMPTPPVGAGALAGWMYGSDKARQDQALQGASGLAQLRAMMEQQKDSETMAGAPGRMAGIQYDNGMAQGKLSTLPDALSTQADTAKAASGKAEIEKLYKYAAGYDPSMTNSEKRAVIDSMKRDGITKIRNRSLDEIADDPDRIDEAMANIKRAAVNSPAHVGAMEVEGLKNQGKTDVADINARRATDVEDIRARYRTETALIRAEAMKDVQRMKKEADEGKLNWNQTKAMYERAAAKGDEAAAARLDYMNAIDLTRDATKASNADPHLVPGKGLQPPNMPNIPKTPVGPSGQAGAIPAGQDNKAPNIKSVGKQVNMDVSSGKLTIDGQSFSLQQGTGKFSGLYKIKDGPLANMVVDKNGNFVGKHE